MIEKKVKLKSKMNYIVFQPKEYTDLPLLIYLHGAGERGDNIEHLYRHGIPKLIHEGKNINAIVLCPQCPEGYVWNNVVKELKELIDLIIIEYNIKPDRIMITGSSMGGFGTWEMGLTYRNFFSVIAPVSGGGMSWRCASLRGTPVLAYHSENDETVPLECSIQMVKAVNLNGGKATLEIIKNCGHSDGINYAYKNTDLIENMLKFKRTNFDYIPDVCEEMF